MAAGSDPRRRTPLHHIHVPRDHRHRLVRRRRAIHAVARSGHLGECVFLRVSARFGGGLRDRCADWAGALHHCRNFESIVFSEDHCRPPTAGSRPRPLELLKEADGSGTCRRRARQAGNRHFDRTAACDWSVFRKRNVGASPENCTINAARI